MAGAALHDVQRLDHIAAGRAQHDRVEEDTDPRKAQCFEQRQIGADHTQQPPPASARYQYGHEEAQRAEREQGRIEVAPVAEDARGDFQLGTVVLDAASGDLDAFVGRRSGFDDRVFDRIQVPVALDADGHLGNDLVAGGALLVDEPVAETDRGEDPPQHQRQQYDLDQRYDVLVHRHSPFARTLARADSIEVCSVATRSRTARAKQPGSIPSC